MESLEQCLAKQILASVEFERKEKQAREKALDEGMKKKH